MSLDVHDIEPLNTVIESYEFYRIMSAMNDALYPIKREAAERVMGYYRTLIRERCTRNHEIFVFAWQGTACVIVGKKRIDDVYKGREGIPIVKLLFDIQRSMQFPWAQFLHWQQINPELDEPRNEVKHEQREQTQADEIQCRLDGILRRGLDYVA